MHCSAIAPMHQCTLLRIVHPTNNTKQETFWACIVGYCAKALAIGLGVEIRYRVTRPILYMVPAGSETPDRPNLSRASQQFNRRDNVMGFWGSPIQLDVRPTNPMDTDVSTVDTLQQMKALAIESAPSPLIASVLNTCLVSTAKRNPSNREIARAIWWWVKNHVRFERDEVILARELGYEKDPNQELLIVPTTLIMMPTPMGDCDDFAMLTGALCLCAHIPYWYVAIAEDENEPNRFSHVYGKCYLPDEQRFMNMDVSFGTTPGWETSRTQYRRAECFVG